MCPAVRYKPPRGAALGYAFPYIAVAWQANAFEANFPSLNFGYSARADLRVRAKPSSRGRVCYSPMTVIAPRERAVEVSPRARLPTRHGVFDVLAFRAGGGEHVALVLGDVAGGERVLARVHSSCLTGDVLGSMRCDCGAQLEAALEAVAREGRGVILYLNQEGRGIGLLNKIRAYALQDAGKDTVEANEELGFPADLRDFGAAAAMLAHLRVASVRLLTNNPRKVQGLEAAGIPVAERVALVAGHAPTNEGYLATKRAKLGHLF